MLIEKCESKVSVTLRIEHEAMSRDTLQGFQNMTSRPNQFNCF